MQIDSIEWPAVIYNLLYVGLAYILSLPVAWNREHGEGGAGLRTFPLVSIASCGYCLIALSAFSGQADAQARILAGLMTGIGFIGGGAILKKGSDVRGVATAASIWATGAIGGAVAFARFEVAILIGIVTFLTLRVMSPIKEKISNEDGGEENGNSA